MKKTLLATAILATMAFSGSAFATEPGNPQSPVLSSGSVFAGSNAGASSVGNGTAWTFTQAGASSTFGAIATPGSVPGGTNLTIGGYTATSGYSTSQSVSTGSGITSGFSGFGASADASAQGVVAAINGPSGVAALTVQGLASSDTLGSAGTSGNGTQSNFAGTESGFTAFGQNSKTTADVVINGVTVPTTTVTQLTNADAFSNGVQQNPTTGWTNSGTGLGIITTNGGATSSSMSVPPAHGHQD